MLELHALHLVYPFTSTSSPGASDVNPFTFPVIIFVESEVVARSYIDRSNLVIPSRDKITSAASKEVSAGTVRAGVEVSTAIAPVVVEDAGDSAVPHRC